MSLAHGVPPARPHTLYARSTAGGIKAAPTSTDPVPLAAGYPPLYVMDDDMTPPDRPYDRTTLAPKRWPLSPAERLLLVVVDQRYLLYETDPRPLTYREAAARFERLGARAGWWPNWVAKRGTLTEQERRRPLKRNLLRGLVESTTLVPPDLALLDD